MNLKMLPLKQLTANDNLPADNTNLLELKSSINNEGIIFPLIAKRSGKDFQIIDGKRRFKACQDLGWKTTRHLPVLIFDADDKKALKLSLIANARRRNYRAWEQAEIANLLTNNFGTSPKTVAKLLGTDKSYIVRLLKIYTLPQPIIQSIRQGKLTLSHGLLLIRLVNRPDDLNYCYKRIIKEELSVRDLETLISSLRQSGHQKTSYQYFSPRVIITKAGSRIRLESRHRSVRVELNIKKEEPLESLFAEIKKSLDKISKHELKAAS